MTLGHWCLDTLLHAIGMTACTVRASSVVLKQQQQHLERQFNCLLYKTSYTADALLQLRAAFVSFCNTHSTGPAHKRAKAVQFLCSCLEQPYHAAVIAYYRAALLEAVDYQHNCSRMSFCTWLCCGARELRRRACDGLAAARAQVEQELSGLDA
jgi:hypothetical protein